MSKKNPAILIAGYEIGGQMQLLAETMRRKGYYAVSVAFNKDFRGYKNDLMLQKKGVVGNIIRLFFSLKAMFTFEIFHFFWGISLLSFWRFHLLDLPFLKLLGKKIVVHYRGRDIINPDYFEYLTENALGHKKAAVELSTPLQLKKIKTWSKYADQILVSTPNLLNVVPDALISPQIIDLKYWNTTFNDRPENNDIVKILHAPSLRMTKGTQIVIDTVNKLITKGYKIELVLIENKSHDSVKEIYETCDIGIDQLLIGWYGKFSVEIMALSKPVVCYIEPKYIKYNPDLPIVSADKDSLEDVLEGLINDTEARQRIGEKSREYVAKYHDVEKVVDQLLEIYGLTEQSLKNDTFENTNGL